MSKWNYKINKVRIDYKTIKIYANLNLLYIKIPVYPQFLYSRHSIRTH